MSLVQISKAATGRQYWRSLNEAAGTPEFRQWVEKEFPGGTDLLEVDSRRNVLKLMAASFGLAGLAACRRPTEHIVPHAKGVEDLIPGKPLYFNTVFAQGGNAIGITVESHDGRPTKIEGNPKHPQSLGATSGYAQASVLNLYDPDRSREVLQSGKSAKWADWDRYVTGELSPEKLGRGAGLRVLSGLVNSPSMKAIQSAFSARFPEAKWVEWEPVMNDQAFAGARAVFGQPYQVHYEYDEADVVVALDSDFLGLEAPAPASIKKFSKRRKVTKPGDEMNRLYSVESQFSVTGAMADHRLRSRSSDVAAFAGALAREIGVTAELNVLNGAPDATQKFLMAVARDLKRTAGRSIVVAGPRQPARVHALALMINQALGNLGKTVVLTPAVAVADRAGIDGLVADLDGGRVSTLVVLDGNPAYTLGSDRIQKAKTVVHLGSDRDETAKIAAWHLPMALPLESWGDAQAIDGTVSIAQPLILPINNGRSTLEIAAQLAGKPPKGLDIVRSTWAKLSDAQWRKALHDGIVAESPAFAPVNAAFDPKRVALPAATPAASGVEVVFYPSWSVYDGRYANNAWMQESPDPMTKLVWDNAALVSPGTAKKLGVTDGDKIQITVAGRSIEAPAMVQPGHADDSVSIALGYGRTEIGRVGKGAGFNGYVIRPVGAFVASGSLAKAAGVYTLVTTQEHHSMEGRAIVREGTVSSYKEHPEFAKHMVEAPDESIYGWWDYSKGYQWGMAVDLNACIGCNACLVSCQAENNIPVVGKDQVARGREMHWIRLDRYYTGSEDDPQAVVQPLPCQQCENAPCESVCPVAATVHSPEGLNDMAYNRCVGTRYCANNCPYKVRRFNFLNYHKEMTEVEKMVSNPDVTVRMRGVMEKCTYCVQRIQEKKIQAKLEGRRAIVDGEIQTACQQACPADAIIFGNINDPSSQVAAARAEPRNYALLAEVNTRPRTTYLAKLRNPNPELVPAGEGAASKEHHG
jgi:MoCo/4Fe-4S cofactor protein with predicted Tat translocation signal